MIIRVLEPSTQLWKACIHWKLTLSSAFLIIFSNLYISESCTSKVINQQILHSSLNKTLWDTMIGKASWILISQSLLDF
jgi:hypothetical protein